MFLLLNNELAAYKPILHFAHLDSNFATEASFLPQNIPNSTDSLRSSSTLFNVFKKIYEINARGYILENSYNTTYYTKQSHLTLIFHGVLKNYTGLCNILKKEPIEHEHPAEIILQLYMEYGFEYTLQVLDGEFAILLFDNNITNSDSRLYVATDRLGLCPLYTFIENTTSNRKILGFSYRARLLETNPEENMYTTHYQITAFPPGTYSVYSYPFKVMSYWAPVLENQRYFINWPKTILSANMDKNQRKKEFMNALNTVQNTFQDSIESLLPPPNTGKIGCLLSGGFDSSLITAFLCDKPIHTFTMGFPGSNDFKHAKTVVEYLGLESSHNEIVIMEEEYIDILPTIVELLETEDIATIRYGAALYFALKHIREHYPEIRHIFTGDGADELMGGYLNFYYMKNMVENDREIGELLSAYHCRGALYKKIFDYFELEWIRPFLSANFMDKFMAIPMDIRFEIESFHVEPTKFDFDKALLRMAFSKEYYKEILPQQIFIQTTEPGYDSISTLLRPLCRIIKDGLSNNIETIPGGEPILEMEYYQEIYKKKFPNLVDSVAILHPYKYAKTKYEPTMRTLDNYLEFHMEYQDRCV